MLIQADNVILFIHPTLGMESPILDDTSSKMEYALEHSSRTGVISEPKNGKCSFTEGWGYKGVHTCTGCAEARSHCRDYAFLILEKEGNVSQFYTNSLAYHYLVYHRSECSQRDIDIVNKITVPKDFVPIGTFRK